MRRTIRNSLVVWLLLAAGAAADCRDLTFENLSFTACSVAKGADVRLFHSDVNDALYGTFSALQEGLAAADETLVFAMNAGMYHPDRTPVGLYIEQDETRAELVAHAGGTGNFSLLPNGVFCVDAGFAVYTTAEYVQRKPICKYATQSGPMLVIAGALHPKFLPDSDSRYIRNGVGVSADGMRAEFVISNDVVNFDTFARLFRDVLKTPDALYFDGKISRLFAPQVGRNDAGFPMGPMVGLVARQP